MVSGFSINTDSFRKYGLGTAKIFVRKYPWFNMPSSVHKVLIHGADIIESVSLPLGMMSEEALEARNKDIRNFRLKHTRKNSRLNTMQDLINSLLVSSDPVITNNGSKTLAFDSEVQNLLLDYSEESENSDSDSDN